MGGRSLSLSAAVLALAALGACTPTKEYHGYVADNPDAPLPVQVGVDTKDTITQRLGSPSTATALDAAPETSWYYISTTRERYAFLRPQTTSRKVTVIRFDGNNVVSAVEEFGMDRGRVIAYNTNETPTRGRELGILEQLLGTIGQGSPIRAGEDPESRTRPGRR